VLHQGELALRRPRRPSLLGEAVTGKGILAQLNLETGIPITEAQPLLLFFDDTTGLERAVIPPGKGFRAEGGPLFGFTKANELFVGRLAQLGNAFSLTGVPVNEIEPLILFFFFAAINPGTGRFVTDDDDDGLQ
jgi:photosystem II protein